MEKKQLPQKFISFMLIGLFSMYAFDIRAGEPIEPKGQWNEEKRTLAITIPVSVYIDGSTLIVKCTSGRSDITISVVGCSSYIYETTVPASDAYFISIDLANAPEGEYQLVLTNQWGDYLTGNFEIY